MTLMSGIRKLLIPTLYNYIFNIYFSVSIISVMTPLYVKHVLKISKQPEISCAHYIIILFLGG